MPPGLLVMPLVLVHLAALLVAIVVVAWKRGRLRLFTAAYRRQLLDLPRLALLAVAILCLFVIAPVLAPTAWSPAIGLAMALGCYVLAPWALGVLVRLVTRGERAWAEALLALVAWLFVASSLHDLAALAHDGAPSPSSLANLRVSSVLFVLGGLFFSVAWDNERGVSLAFLHRDWPAWSGDRGGWWRTWPLYVVIALPVAAVVAAIAMN